MKQLYTFIGSHLAFARHHFNEGYRARKNELQQERYHNNKPPVAEPVYGQEM